VAFPGLRVGWIVAPAAAIERLRIVKQTTDLHTDQLAQGILAEFLAARALQQAPRQDAEGLHLGLAALDEALRKAYAGRHTLGCGRRRHVPVAGASSGVRASELLIHAKERGVLFAPGRYFYVQSPLPTRCGWALRAWTKSKSRGAWLRLRKY